MLFGFDKVLKFKNFNYINAAAKRSPSISKIKENKEMHFENFGKKSYGYINIDKTF